MRALSGTEEVLNLNLVIIAIILCVVCLVAGIAAGFGGLLGFAAKGGSGSLRPPSIAMS